MNQQQSAYGPVLDKPRRVQRAQSAGDSNDFYKYKNIIAKSKVDGYHSAGEYEYDNGSTDGAEFATAESKTFNSKTGRLRKKIAARSKGGNFNAQRKKRRVYFACVSSDIDVQDLYDYLTGAGGSFQGWNYKIYDRVLWMFKPGNASGTNNASLSDEADLYYKRQEYVNAETNAPFIFKSPLHNNERGYKLAHDADIYNAGVHLNLDKYRISEVGAQEVFVFDFGAAVMW